MAGASTMLLGKDAEDALAGKVEAAPEQDHAEDLLCPMCTRPAFFCPVKTVPCGHLFHKCCLEDWLTGKAGPARRCPMCSTELPPGNAHTNVDFSVRAILDRLKVTCPQGCQPEPQPKRMRYDQLAAHIQECPKTPMLCGSAGCGVVLPRREMEGTHAAQCEYARITCGLCIEEIKRGTLRSRTTDGAHASFTCSYCNTGDILVCKKESHELQCAGPVQMSVVAELRRQNRELKETSRKLQEQNEELQEKMTAELLGHREMLEHCTVSQGRTEAELQTQGGQVLQLLQQNSEILGLVRSMLCPRVKVTSAESPKHDGEYTLVQEKENGHSAWRSANGCCIYRVGGSWLIGDSPALIPQQLGSLQLRATGPHPVAASGWKVITDAGWLPAPGTSVSVGNSA
eukprot:TRINITY_DN8343_c0_g1_i1.p1 TRINITY_DN8343_c0_g1~~TRINITY_DN8343_c0_g1_i1.p1  ORF type:complete len:400 (+),score=85.20 TRINITY_DN8343_c0_g1_i1:78-1277(+)